MADKNTYSKRYTDEELRAKAICVINNLNDGNDIGVEFVMAMSHRTGMHPQAVINEVQRLANIKL